MCILQAANLNVLSFVKTFFQVTNTGIFRQIMSRLLKLLLASLPFPTVRFPNFLDCFMSLLRAHSVPFFRGPS